MKRTDRLTRAAEDYTIILCGAALYALSVDFFTSANDIAPGGVTGTATALNHLFGFPIGLCALILNIPLLIWGGLRLGGNYIKKTVFGAVAASVMIDAFALIGYHYSGERILAALFGGLIGGAGLSLIFFRGGSTGGTDIIASIVNRRFPHISVGSVILISDAVVVCFSAIAYQSLESALYAVITIFVSAKIIDSLTYGLSRDNGKLLIIISAYSDEIAEKIIERGHRGVTSIPSKGCYTGKRGGALLCAARPSEVYLIKNIATTTDPSAFIIITAAAAISGNGFTQ